MHFFAVADKEYFSHNLALPPFARVMPDFAVLGTTPIIPLSMAYLGISWQIEARYGSKNGSKTPGFYYHLETKYLSVFYPPLLHKTPAAFQVLEAKGMVFFLQAVDL